MDRETVNQLKDYFLTAINNEGATCEEATRALGLAFDEYADDASLYIRRGRIAAGLKLMQASLEVEAIEREARES